MTVKEAKTELREYRAITERLAAIHAMRVRTYLNLGMMRFKARGREEVPSYLAERIKNAEIREAVLTEKEEYAIARSEQLKRSVDYKISRLSEADSKILSEKYRCGRTLISISIEMCYEYTWLCKLHKRALENYAAVEEPDDYGNADLSYTCKK